MTKIKSVFLISITLLSITLSCATASNSGKTSVPLENNPALVSGSLENGLSYHILQNKYPENRIFLRLAVKIGSIVEADNERGLAHFVEHLGFNGSAHFAENELISYFESIGMAFGPDVNAYTSFDETVYKLEIPADNPEALAASLTVISDWAGGLTFDPAEVEKERGVVLEEWRLNRGVTGRALDALLPFLFPFSRYANRQPIGKPEVILNAPQERIVNFYKKWYRPELMSLVIVGDADSAQLEQAVQKHLSAIPAGTKKPKRPDYQVSALKTKLSLLLSDPETPYTEVLMGSLFPSIMIRTAEDYRLAMAMDLARSVLNARLYEQVEDTGLFLSASSYQMEVLNSMTAGIGWFRPRNGRFAEAFRIVLDETDRFVQFGITESELDRGKANLRTQALDNWQNRNTLESAELATGLVESVLNNTPVLSPDRRYQLALDTISGLSADDVNRMIKQHYPGRGTRLVVRTAPDAGLPSKKSIDQIWKNYRNPSLAPYNDSLDERPLFPPVLAGQPGSVTAERILAEGIDGNPSITELTLSNGAKVVVCPTDFKKDFFLFNAVSRGGLSLADDDHYPSAKLSSYYAEISGLNGFKQTEVTKKLAGTRVYVEPVLDETAAGLQGSGAARDMESFLQLLNLYFTAPDFREPAWEQTRSRIISNIESVQKYPQWALYAAMQKALYGDALRFNQYTPQYLEKINSAEAENWYRRFYKEAGNFTFIFTGDISLDEVKRLSTIYLASLPAAAENTEAKDFYPPFPEGKPVIQVKKGIEPQSAVRICFGGENPEIEGDVLTEQELVAAMADLVGIRLREKIREKMGAVYYIDVYCRQSNYPTRRYNGELSFSCEPAQAEELGAQVIRELQGITEAAITEGDLTKLRERFIRTRETALKTNEFWQNVLRENYLRGEASVTYSDPETAAASITAETMSRLIRRYFNPNNYVTGILLPE